METKIEKISELSKLLSVKNRMSDDLFHLFGRFGIGHLLSCLSLEKQDGISVSELILPLCLFRIVGESIHSICKHKIYELSNHGKNCFYRMMIRPQMDWRRLMNHFALRYMSFVKAFEVYQIRWNIEVMNKETKQYLGLGSGNVCISSVVCHCNSFHF